MMDKFEEKLFNLKIPEISDKYLEYDLKERLEKKLFYNKFKLPYQIAFTSALLMFILTISLVINPDIANRINSSFSRNNASQLAEVNPVENIDHNKTLSPDDFVGFEGLAYVNKEHENMTGVQTVADENDEIKTIKYLNPDDFEEGKVYMIRKYKSQDQQGMIMINEINNSSKGVIRKM